MRVLFKEFNNRISSLEMKAFGSNLFSPIQEKYGECERKSKLKHVCDAANRLNSAFAERTIACDIA